MTAPEAGFGGESGPVATKSRAKVCAECKHRAGRHGKGWGCNVVGCDCAEQPPFRPSINGSGDSP